MRPLLPRPGGKVNAGFASGTASGQQLPHFGGIYRNGP
jgi:hypothetical protein